MAGVCYRGVFFFQAEDGIRDVAVTGVQTCALPISHRGASGHAPENTLAAFKKAVALGATFIETDLQLSRDARFVAIHDDTLDRTTNGQGKVHDQTLGTLRKLDAGSWFGSEYTGERIPTLEEILEFSKKNDVVFYLELKPSGSWGGEHALIGALRESREIPRAVVISFDASIVLSLRKIEPTLMTGLLYDGQVISVGSIFRKLSTIDASKE